TTEFLGDQIEPGAAPDRQHGPGRPVLRAQCGRITPQLTQEPPDAVGVLVRALVTGHTDRFTPGAATAAAATASSCSRVRQPVRPPGTPRSTSTCKGRPFGSAAAEAA